MKASYFYSERQSKYCNVLSVKGILFTQVITHNEGDHVSHWEDGVLVHVEDNLPEDPCYKGHADISSIETALVMGNQFFRMPELDHDIETWQSLFGC